MIYAITSLSGTGYFEPKEAEGWLNHPDHRGMMFCIEWIQSEEEHACPEDETVDVSEGGTHVRDYVPGTDERPKSEPRPHPLDLAAWGMS